MNKLLVCLGSLALVSCSSTQTSTQSSKIKLDTNQQWNIYFKEDVLNLNFDDFLESFKKNKIDDLATNKIAKVLNQYNYLSDNSIIIGGDKTCTDLYPKAINSIKNIIKDDGFISYKLEWNTATGTKVHPRVSMNITEQIQSNTSTFPSVKLTLKENMLWLYGGYKPHKGEGYATIDFLVDFKCNNQELQAKISPSYGEIVNPTLQLLSFQNIATISINSSKIDHKLASIHNSAIFPINYEVDLNKLKAEISDKLDSRFEYKPLKRLDVITQVMPFELKVLNSRFKRKLTIHDGYDETTPIFYSEHVKDVLGIETKITTNFELYPEENSSTAVKVYSTFIPVIDTFNNKQLISGEYVKGISKSIFEDYKRILSEI